MPRALHSNPSLAVTATPTRIGVIRIASRSLNGSRNVTVACGCGVSICPERADGPGIAKARTDVQYTTSERRIAYEKLRRCAYPLTPSNVVRQVPGWNECRAKRWLVLFTAKGLLVRTALGLRWA